MLQGANRSRDFLLKFPCDHHHLFRTGLGLFLESLASRSASGCVLSRLGFGTRVFFAVVCTGPGRCPGCLPDGAWQSTPARAVQSSGVRGAMDIDWRPFDLAPRAFFSVENISSFSNWLGNYLPAGMNKEHRSALYFTTVSNPCNPHQFDLKNHCMIR